MGFDNQDIYGIVRNSVTETSDLHLSMAIFCNIKFLEVENMKK